MAYPPYIQTRTVTFGGAQTLESSQPLSIRATIRASRSLVWDDTGYRFESVTADLVPAEEGGELTFIIPRTDVPGWRDSRLNALIDVSAEGAFSHTYVLTVEFNLNGRRVSGATVGPFTVPDGEGSLDLDKVIPVGTTAGSIVTIPDAWTAAVNAAQAAAVAAEESAADAAAVLLDSDAFVADKINDAESQTREALTAQTADAVAAAGAVRNAVDDRAAVVAYPRAAADSRYAISAGVRGVCHGDSITAGSEGGVADANRVSLPMLIGALSGQRIRILRNAGKPGKRSDELLATFETDVAPYAPDFVHFMAGTNDATAGRTVAQYATSVTAYVAKVRAIGAQPIIGILPPNTVTTDRRELTIQYASWLRAFCAAEGITAIDYYSLLVNAADGTFTAALTSDGTHPRNGTNVAMAQLAVDTLLAKFATVPPVLPRENTDPWNIVANGLMLGATSGTTGPGGTIMPASWTRTGGRSANTTGEVDATDATIKGSWWRLSAAASTGGELWSQTLTAAKIIPAHRYLFTHRVKATGLRNANSGAGATLLSTLRFNGQNGVDGYDIRAMSRTDYDLTGIVAAEVVAPADAATAQVIFDLQVTTSSSFDVRVGQIGVYDLTALGLTGRQALDVTAAGQP